MISSRNVRDSAEGASSLTMSQPVRSSELYCDHESPLQILHDTRRKLPRLWPPKCSTSAGGRKTMAAQKSPRYNALIQARLHTTSPCVSQNFAAIARQNVRLVEEKRCVLGPAHCSSRSRR